MGNAPRIMDDDFPFLGLQGNECGLELRQAVGAGGWRVEHA
jgi:hypothetical protein